MTPAPLPKYPLTEAVSSSPRADRWWRVAVTSVGTAELIDVEVDPSGLLLNPDEVDEFMTALAAARDTVRGRQALQVPEAKR